MKFSLFLTGILFFVLQFVTSFVGFCFGIFFVMLIADSFRPAMFVALNSYSKPKNKTRSLTLIRLAINLGFSAGPVIGGLIITSFGYVRLFWIDGITWLLASTLLIKVLSPKNSKIIDKTTTKNLQSVFSDKIFQFFFISMFLFGFIFLQYFSTVPLYYKNRHHLSESEIGILMGLNGFLIFILEMPLVKWLEDTKYSKVFLMSIGVFLTGTSFALLNSTNWTGILIIGMLIMTLGEMITFPFSNAFALERAKKGKQGEYMAYYSIAFSASHIFSHNSGMQLIHNIGYNSTWNIMITLSLLGIFSLTILTHLTKREHYKLKPNNNSSK